MKIISQRNCAPSAEHASHDVYLFGVDTAGSARPFCFEQSIGGGHAERGGAAYLNLAGLANWPGDWRLHLEKAGCGWVADVLAHAASDAQAVTAILARAR